MTRTTPGLAPSSPSFYTAPASLTHDVRFGVHQAHMHCGSLVKLGYDPRTLLPRKRDLTTRPPRPFNIVKLVVKNIYESSRPVKRAEHTLWTIKILYQ
ncbi:hypothetical protein AVEN_258761-1 [Araneus ventricosus]|uniref:Uncharacterized protein n=1 Tax=Araneus ventricosus TaxID=182803 RepID=A0A4Y2D1E6_ARAVE|nr:hypothetical protein AVEN_258761-1 [Araneus ventricosus]